MLLNDLHCLESSLENLCSEFGKDLTQTERLAIIKVLSIVDRIKEGEGQLKCDTEIDVTEFSDEEVKCELIYELL